MIILRAANSFDGRDHVISAAAFELHIMSIANSTANDRPGLVPDASLSSLTGKARHSLGAEPAALAAELCTAGLWERVNGGYRILDTRAIQVCADHVRELREQGKQAPRLLPGGCRSGPRRHRAAPRAPERSWLLQRHRGLPKAP
jgi:hypothetical protein